MINTQIYLDLECILKTESEKSMQKSKTKTRLKEQVGAPSFAPWFSWG